MPRLITPQDAEILGLKALGWLAGQPDGLGRFLAVSGIEAAQLRAAAASAELQGAVLEFLLADEPLLIGFCNSSSIDPRDVLGALRALEVR